MCIPAPTDVNMAYSPLVILYPSTLPFLTRSNRVGMVATELFPSHEMVIGTKLSGTASNPYNLNTRFIMAWSIFPFA
ncbi:hypothetical protein D3C87_1825320 [compost metagenome]